MSQAQDRLSATRGRRVRRSGCSAIPRAAVFPPCSADPDLWFGYCDDGDTSTGKGIAYARSAEQARAVCLTQCPEVQQRLCAAKALERDAADGVWAAVRLPGLQNRHRVLLATAREQLRQTRSVRSTRVNCLAVLRCWEHITV